MNTIRIGNDINVTWKIFSRNGMKFSLEEKELQLWLVSGPYKHALDSFHVQWINEVAFSIDATELTRYGVYKLILRIREPEAIADDAAYDLTEMFQIVSKSYTDPVTDAVDGAVDLVFTSILNNVFVSTLRGLSAYEIAVEHGYEGTEEEWLNDPINGIKGVGIESVAVVGGESRQDSAVNKYRITMTDSDTFDFNVRNGKGISGVVQETVGVGSDAQSTIRVDYSEGPASRFVVKNGSQGNSGYTGAAGELEVVNNLTDGGATSALSAEQGKVLDGLVSDCAKYISEHPAVEPDSVENGAYVSDNGAIVEDDAFSYKIIPVVAGRQYLFSGHFSSNVTIYFMYWFNSSHQYVSRVELRGTGESIAYKYIPVAVPDGVSYVYTNIQNSRSDEFGFYDIGGKIDFSKDGMRTRGILASCDLDDVGETGTWLLIDTNTYQNLPAGVRSGYIRVSRLNGYVLQEYFSFDGSALFSRRVGLSWVRHDFPMGILPSSDLNAVKSVGTWLLADANEYEHVPNNSSVGFIRISVTGIWVLQEYYSFNGSKLYKRKFTTSTDPSRVEDWELISGGGTVYNVTNEYEFNEYSNTYNVTATPTITADTNNYLASAGDDTDRTADILAMLSTTGACHLGPGVFYLKDLQMPDSTSIIGSGMATRVYMLTGNGFAIKMGSRCQVKDFRLFGTTSSYTPVSTIGDRHGILWQGDYTQRQVAPFSSIISDMFIDGFNGGGITCYDTGYGTHNFLACTNVLIENCDAGINISYWSEFHKFTNVRTRSCYYGCINNGGNNVFTNCDFSSCSGKAFVMDNSQGQSPNNSHGSCVACVFNHTASNTGVGIEILNCTNGFIFSACQIFYSQINMKDSSGVVFSNCNFGANNCDITIDGGGAVLFMGNMYQSATNITVTDNTHVHFVNCYNRSTGAEIGA